MALNLDAYPPKVKAQQIKLGQQFGSQDTLAQAQQTLDSYAKHGAALGPRFAAADALRLADARDLLITAGVGREVVRGQKKVTSKAYVDAVKDGQAERLDARALVEALKDDLEEAGNEAAAAIISAALKQTQVASDEAEALAKQLDVLKGALENTEVATAAAGRGGPAAVTELTTAATKLRAADQADAGVQGTPAETQKLDQIDGIIVRLVRRARRAAIAAGRKKGDEALADAFKLDKLYQSRAPASSRGEEDGEDEGDADTEPPQK